MAHDVLVQIVAILILGVFAQWLAWWLRLPSILLLLATGVVVGPVTGLIHPDVLFGDLLFPFVSLSVAIILFGGGLNLKVRELGSVGGVFVRLMTVGVAVTLAVGIAAAHFVLGFRWPLAALLGSILVVTGPTVVGPILRHLHLRGRVGALLKWEGIMVDPLGATLAVLVFTVVQAGALRHGIGQATLVLVLTLVTGLVVGTAAAGLVVLALSRFWVPDFLHNAVSLMVMVLAYAVGNRVQDEAGLLVVTVMGIALANQRRVSIRHVVEFKETLGLLLISFLFVVLAARLSSAELLMSGWATALFVAVMIAVARPLSILVATWRTSLDWKERLFLACMAPRGIVAAAVASIFALAFVDAGYPRAIEMVSATFALVFVSVLVYGLGAGPLARRLGLTQAHPQGVLFVGAHSWARSLAAALQGEGCPVFLIDTDWDNVSAARMEGLPCIYGSALADQTREEIDFRSLGRMLALTSSNELNSLACLRFAEEFGRREVYQLPFSPAKDGRHEEIPLEHRGRLLFGEDLTFVRLSELMANGPHIRKTRLTKEFDFTAFTDLHGTDAIAFFVVKPSGLVQVCTVNGWSQPEPQDRVVSLAVDVGEPDSELASSQA